MQSKLKAFFICITMLSSILSCKHSIDIDIHLSKDQQSIIVSGLGEKAIKQLQADSLNAEAWKNLFTVFVESSKPEGSEAKDSLITGKYLINSREIIFHPDQRFQLGETYICRFYGSSHKMSVLKILFGSRLPRMDALTEVKLHIK